MARRSEGPCAGGPLSIGVLRRVINSRGLAIVGPLGGADGWYWATVQDAKTGEPKGKRWIHRREDGSWDVRSEAPV